MVRDPSMSHRVKDDARTEVVKWPSYGYQDVSKAPTAILTGALTATRADDAARIANIV